MFTFIPGWFHLSNFHSEMVVQWISYSSWICDSHRFTQNAFHVFKTLMEVWIKTRHQENFKARRELGFSEPVTPKYNSRELPKSLWGCVYFDKIQPTFLTVQLCPVLWRTSFEQRLLISQRCLWQELKSSRTVSRESCSHLNTGAWKLLWSSMGREFQTVGLTTYSWNILF